MAGKAPAQGKPVAVKAGGKAGGQPGSQPGAMTEGQRAYEQRRADKAGMPLDRWLEQKRRAEAAEVAARTRAERADTPKKKSLLSRLIDRAHKPLS